MNNAKRRRREKQEHAAESKIGREMMPVAERDMLEKRKGIKAIWVQAENLF